jgi:ABC-type polysaccharide transport system permease subunit
MTDAALPLPHSSQKRQRLWQKIKTVQMLYLLVLPSSIIILLIGYYPKIDVIIKSMYRWSPPEVEEFVGFNNFLEFVPSDLYPARRKSGQNVAGDLCRRRPAPH